MELRNGNMKTIWKIFAQNRNTRSLLHLDDDCRIGAALINKFYKKIVTGNNDDEIAWRMLDRVNEPNLLHPIVDSVRFQRYVKDFTEVDTNSFIFPTLTENDLELISLGKYQIKQARSYAT